MLEKWRTRAVSKRSWLAGFDEIQKHDFNLSAGVYKPIEKNAITHKDPNVLLEEIIRLQKESAEDLIHLKQDMKNR